MSAVFFWAEKVRVSSVPDASSWMRCRRDSNWRTVSASRASDTRSSYGRTSGPEGKGSSAMHHPIAALLHDHNASCGTACRS